VMGYLRVVVLAVLLMTSFSSVYGGNCFKDGDYESCRVKAEQGYSEAQYNLGGSYEYGQGVLQDYKEAVKWYRLAAEQGFAPAQFNLGLMYHHGQGVLQNDKEAVKWTRKSAEQGFAPAQYNLGLSYETGQGVLQNDKEAFKWIRESAEQGVAKAQFRLGLMYAVNDKEAFKWYRLAAEQGYTEAQFWLGLMYAVGEGVIKDFVMAHMYFNIAAVSGNKDAIKERDSIEGVMSASQLEEAQKLAREWMQAHQ
jgi:uncharacterized protein